MGLTDKLTNLKDPNRMLLFSTTENLRILSQGAAIMADGTFKSVPRLFTQLYTLHSFLVKRSVQLVYCVLSSKTRFDYNRVLNQLDIRCAQDNIHLNPQSK